MADKDVVIRVENLTKTFKIPLEASSGIKQKLINTLKGRKGYREFTPLNNMSFEIEEGDFFGIVGRNGSGKSTLLKTLAGIYAPDAGAVSVKGKLVPFIELGVGFNPELSGRENVFLNGALLGFSRKEMEQMYDDIVDFAELHDFMEERLKNYSSGMQVRLAFSIAIRAKGDILLLDEILAVGDEAFQRKCTDYFINLKKEGRTVILVTHDMGSVQKFCNKALFIDKGSIEFIGSPSDVAERYTTRNMAVNVSTATDALIAGADIQFKTLDANGNEKRTFSPREKMIIEITARAGTSDISNPRIGLVVNNDMGVPVIATNTNIEKFKMRDVKKGKSSSVRFELRNILNDGYYTLSGAVTSNNTETVFVRKHNEVSFAVSGWEMKAPVIHPDIEVTAL